MSEGLSWAATVRLVHERAGNCREYCATCLRVTGQPMHVDHIIPGGGNHPDNLALACASCNLSKGDFTDAVDPATGQHVPLFNPRKHFWIEHFRWIDDGCRVQGLSPEGRATVERLSMDQERVVIARSLWVEAGLHPPGKPVAS